MDKRSQRAKINAASTVLYQLISTMSGMVIPWIMIRHFGSVAYGITTSIAQFLAYISLFEGGIGRVARGALYKPLAEGNVSEISRVYYAIKRFFGILGLAFAGYALVLACCYYDIADVTGFTREYIFALVIAISIGKFAEYMGGISNITLLNADQRQYVINVVSVLATLLNVLAVIVLANMGADIFWVKLVSSFVFVLKPIVFTIYLQKKYSIQKTAERAVLKNKVTGIAQHAAYVVHNSTDVLILTICSDLKYVAVYSVYHLISFSLRNITTSFTGGMEALFGDMIAKRENAVLCDNYFLYKLILTILTITLYGTAGALIVPFVRLYTSGATDAEYIQPLFAILLLLSDAINCLILPCYNLPIAANRLKETQWGAYLEATINLGLTCILVLWNPLLGVVIGTLVSAIFKGIYYIVYSGKKVLCIKAGNLIFQNVITILVLICVMVVGMMIFSYIRLSNYWWWILAGVGTVIVSGIVAVTLGAYLYHDTFRIMVASVKQKL